MSASNTRSGVDVPTLLITAAASATAAYVTSKIWAAGTLGAAATMPVLVALLKEAYAKPADVVTRVVPVRGVVRSTAPGDQHYEPVQPTGPALERTPQYGELQGRSRPRAGRAWKSAVVTGLLGFLIAAVIVTVPEFVAGSSAAGGDRQTTFFGGETDTSDEEDSTITTPDETEPQTLPPGATVTVPPVETTTVPPAQTTTVPPAQTGPALPPEPEPGSEPDDER